MLLTFVEQTSSRGDNSWFRRFGCEPLGIFRSGTGLRQSQYDGRKEEGKEAGHRHGQIVCVGEW
jgi:hypothetical protein